MVEKVYVDYTKNSKHENMEWSQSVLTEMEYWYGRMKSERNLESDIDDEKYERRLHYYDMLVKFMEHLTDKHFNSHYKKGVR